MKFTGFSFHTVFRGEMILWPFLLFMHISRVEWVKCRIKAQVFPSMAHSMVICFDWIQRLGFAAFGSIQRDDSKISSGSSLIDIFKVIFAVIYRPILFNFVPKKKFTTWGFGQNRLNLIWTLEVSDIFVECHNFYPKPKLESSVNSNVAQLQNSIDRCISNQRPMKCTEKWINEVEVFGMKLTLSTVKWQQFIKWKSERYFNRDAQVETAAIFIYIQFTRWAPCNMHDIMPLVKSSDTLLKSIEIDCKLNFWFKFIYYWTEIEERAYEISIYVSRFVAVYFSFVTKTLCCTFVWDKFWTKIPRSNINTCGLIRLNVSFITL